VTEQQAYEVVRSYDDFELRRYAPHLVAEVVVNAPFEEAGNIAFRTLFRYITGQNEPSQKVAMTAPVIQRGPDIQRSTGMMRQREVEEGGYAIAFVLPSSLTLETAPEPTSPDVRLHERPGTLAAARRYRGHWTKGSFEENRDALIRAIDDAGLTPVGAPMWARFDPPFMPWFLRRNEVVQEVRTDGADPGPRA
jgi:hypothetical protein